MNIKLKKLPYHYTSLEPYISRETLRIHYEGHHAGYVKTFNKLVAMESEDISALNFNFNGNLLHELYWESLAAGPILMGPKLSSLLISQFGSVKSFINKLLTACASHQGSGWTLLLQASNNRLLLKNIPNHDFKKIADKYNILLVLDAWEHAYYIDYRNDKKKFFDQLLNIIDWQAAESRII